MRQGEGKGVQTSFPPPLFCHTTQQQQKSCHCGGAPVACGCELPYLVIKVTCCQTVCAGVSRGYSGGGESLRSPCRSSESFNPRRTQQDHRREAAECKTPNVTMERRGSRKRLHQLQVAAAKRRSTRLCNVCCHCCFVSAAAGVLN